VARVRSAHTVDQVRAAEAALMARLPAGTLMQRAAAGLAGAVAEFLGQVYGARVLLLVGSGDNGGDALFAGALLARRGAAVQAVLLSADRAHPAGLAALRAAAGVVVTTAESARRPDVVVDGIVGIGGRAGLRPEAARAVDAFAGVPFVAVDVPSGVDVDTGRTDGSHVRAAVTVTFGTHKVAHLVDPAALACGAVHLIDIGLTPPGATVTSLQAQDVAALLPVPEPTAHKYTRGVVGVRAGSEQYAGAAVLCVAGAGCGLAGMVRYDPPHGSATGTPADLVRATHPETVVGAGRVQAWVVGSGGGDAAGPALSRSLADGVPVVVDADGLSHLDGPLEVPALLTPHAGELARMLGVERTDVEADQLRHARVAAERFGATVLLKGRHTLVVAPDGGVRVNTVGTPWLATAGAGDVLSGLCGALMAAGLDPFDAGSVGAWLHGAAAVRAASVAPLTAAAVADAIPGVCADLLR
jgi:ADP-dependent NAD(P)H-hydrate dehydratase / NAD(P)H-hydrate epimerase